VMLLNDEAHHVWDPDSAWNEAIRYLHDTIMSRTGGGLVCQLDFSATPKDNKGQIFKHIVCDTPLGEAVDAGIVKTPIIGKADKSLEEQADDNAAYKFERHLRLGYERWRLSREEWEKSGKKALMFVMCEDTEAADQIANRLNTDDVFKELNGKTINLHTNLKGKVKKIGRGANAQIEFVANEKEISDEDLKALRKLSRELDNNSSPYNCIVSVLMLREGWDVRNVTTVVPLRPYSSKANILPEQTLGRGLRRITPPGGANEIVTIVDHPAFASLYQQELSQEGLPIEIIDVDKVPRTTVSIYPDERNKDINALEILIPRLSAGHRIIPKLEDVTLDEVKAIFKSMNLKPLPLAGEIDTTVEYEGKQLFTGEIVEKMTFHIELLQSGIGAVSYYVKQLEMICKVRGIHTVIAPLMQNFLEEILFEKKSSLFEQELIARLGNSDVGEYVRAVFVPLIRKHTTTTEKRTPEQEPMALSTWRPYQVTHSERRPVLPAQKTLFNLVPCNRDLELAMTEFLTGRAMDVAAFAKNAGPQCLRIDYIGSRGRLAFYTPDFFVRATSGHYYIIETKGREDIDVPKKARAALEWCKSASKKKCKWEYIYVSQGVFERLSDDSIEALARTCAPTLQNLLAAEEEKVQMPLFASIIELEEAEQEILVTEGIVDKVILESLPDRYRKAAEQAISVFRFLENKKDINYGQVFQALLGSIDEACRGLLLKRLLPLIPDMREEQRAWFNPYVDSLGRAKSDYYRGIAKNLRKTLIYRNGFSPLGLLRNCLDYALNDSTQITGIFEAIKQTFNIKDANNLLTVVGNINEFRNMYVAHQDKELKDVNLAREQLGKWIAGLKYISSQS